MVEKKKNDLREFAYGFKEGFHAFGKSVTLVINIILTGAVYFLILDPTSLLSKIGKKSFLNLSTEKRKSYWEELNQKKKDKEYYYSQY
jgi:hypothetical protein